MTTAFGPALGEKDSGLNGLAETNFISKDGASGKWGPKGKKCGFHLMGIEVNLGIGQCRR